MIRDGTTFELSAREFAVLYLVTLDEINEVLDLDLKNVAWAMAAYQAAGGAPGQPMRNGDANGASNR